MMLALVDMPPAVKCWLCVMQATAWLVTVMRSATTQHEVLGAPCASCSGACPVAL